MNTNTNNSANFIAKLGNDKIILVSFYQSESGKITTDGEKTPFDITAAQDLKVALVSLLRGKSTPLPAKVQNTNQLAIELNIDAQRLGNYYLDIRFNLASEQFEDGLRACRMKLDGVQIVEADAIIGNLSGEMENAAELALLEKINTLNVELADAVAQRDLMKENNKTLTSDLDAANARIRAKEEEIAEANRELEAARANDEQDRLTIEQLTANVEQLTQQAEEKTQEITRITADLQVANQQLAEARANDEADAEKIAQLTQQVSELNNQLTAATQSSKALTAELNETKEALRIARANDAADAERISQLTEENAALKSEKSTLAEENATLKEQKNTLTQENTILKSEKSALAEENTTLKEQKSALEASKRSLEENIDGVRGYLKKEGFISNNIITRVRKGDLPSSALVLDDVVRLDSVEEIDENAIQLTTISRYYLPSVRKIARNAFSKNENPYYEIHIPDELFREYKSMSYYDLEKIFVPEPYSHSLESTYVISICNISSNDFIVIESPRE